MILSPLDTFSGTITFSSQLLILQFYSDSLSLNTFLTFHLPTEKLAYLNSTLL